jgi:hypothetical protein
MSFYSKPVRFADSSALTPVDSYGPRRTTGDGFMTFDAATQLTIDSTGAFLIGELERLDQTLHDPLVAITWPRDMPLREDVQLADEDSSFTNSSFAAPGGISPNGINWISKDANAISGISLDIGKTVHPLNLWGMEVKWTIPELQSAAKLGRPIDDQKYQGMKLKHQMDADNLVYIGDQVNYLYPGMANQTTGVFSSNVVNGAAGSPLWTMKTPDEIVADVNNLLTSVWQTAGYAVVSSKLLLTPQNFSYITTQKVSSAGNVSILQYIKMNCITNASTGRELDIQPCKWLVGLGTGGASRMVAYCQEKDRVRFPMVPLQRTPLEHRSIWQVTTYFGRFGQVEEVYPELTGYSDGM